MTAQDEVARDLEVLRGRRLTLPEAAAVAGADPKEVRRAADKGLLRVEKVRRGRRAYRVVGGDGVLSYLIGSAARLRSDQWDALHRALLDQASWVVVGRQVLAPLGGAGDGNAIAPVFVGLAEPVRRAVDEIRRLDRAAEGIALRRDGEPVIKGTEIEVHRIAALIEGGMPVAEVVGDYAGDLTAEAVEDAVRYARAHPKQGRPYPARTAKAALRAGRGGLKRAFAASSAEG